MLLIEILKQHEFRWGNGLLVNDENCECNRFSKDEEFRKIIRCIVSEKISETFKYLA